MKQSPVESESTAGRTRRYPRAKDAPATTLPEDGTQSFEAPANRGVRTRVKANTDTQNGVPRPGMLTAGIRPGAELKSNETRGIAADEARVEAREPEESGAQAPWAGSRADLVARPSIRRDTRLELARQEAPAASVAKGPELLRMPLRRDPMASMANDTRYLGRPRNAPGAGVGVGEARGEEGHWGWIAAMVLAILALGVSVYVAFGR
jgi:hypothetical protein